MDFLKTKENLTFLADKLFQIKENKITKTVDLEKRFNHIGPDIHGVVSFSPQEQFESDTLEYHREQGRTLFDVFLTVAIQSGVYLGYKQMEKKTTQKIKELEEHLSFYKNWQQSESEKVKQLMIEKMPSGDLEDEIKDLRKQLIEKNSKIKELLEYKTKITEIQKIVK